MLADESQQSNESAGLIVSGGSGKKLTTGDGHR